jgi:hypothetical protein
MEANVGSISIMNPVAPRRQAVVPLAPRLRNLAGTTLALVDNSKPGATELLRGLARGLESVGCTTIYFRKQHPVMLLPFLEEIRLRCQAAVVAIGDCGAGTSWSAQDVAALEEAGLPAAFLAIEACEEWARTEARSAGLAAPRIALVRGEPEFLPAASVEELGEDVASAVASVLTNDGANG